MRFPGAVPLSVATVTAGIASLAIAQDTPFAGHALYGINRDHGWLVRYDFDAGKTIGVGSLTLNNQPLAGVNGAAYIPGFRNVYAFWYDRGTHDCLLLYVDLETAQTTAMHALEGGAVTGATSAANATTGQWHVYAVQQAEVPPPFTVRGLVNLNPNNSPQNEFTLRNPAGGTITRDTLHSGTTVDAQGNAYVGDAVYIHFKPKGNGNQNGLLIDGVSYPLQNSNTYTLNGQMTVRVFNDKLKNGKAMGHWWLEVTGGTALWADAEVTTPSRLVQIDHMTGTVTELMRTTRDYDGLATLDAVTFLATSGAQLWRLDPTAETETLVGNTGVRDVFGLEYLGQTLTGFEAAGSKVTMVNVATGQTALRGIPIYAGDLGTIVYTPLQLDPALLPESYD